jgi:hypothetical protein
VARELLCDASQNRSGRRLDERAPSYDTQILESLATVDRRLKNLEDIVGQLSLAFAEGELKVVLSDEILQVLTPLPGAGPAIGKESEGLLERVKGIFGRSGH